MQTIDIHVPQRTALTGRVEHRVDNATAEIIVQTAVGAEHRRGRADRPELCCLLLQEGKLRHIRDRDGLEQHKALGIGEGKQLPRLGRGGDKGLFKDDMVSCVQRPLGGGIVQVVGCADVNGIEAAGGVAGVLIGVDGRDAVLRGPCLGLGAALGTAAESLHRDLRHGGGIGKELVNNAAGGNDSEGERHSGTLLSYYSCNKDNIPRRLCRAGSLLPAAPTPIKPHTFLSVKQIFHCI